MYVFRGSPAAGKSTLVPQFCELLPSPVALIGHDTLRWGFHKVHRAYAEVGDHEHLFAFNNLLVLLDQYLQKEEYTVAVEGLFTWNDYESSQGNMQQIMDVAAACGKTCVSIVLKADREELERRNAERSYSVPDDEFDALYTNVYKQIGAEEIIINTTGEKPEESLARLHSMVRTTQKPDHQVGP